MATNYCLSNGPADTQTEISSFFLCRRCDLRCFIRCFYPSTRIWQVQSQPKPFSAPLAEAQLLLVYLCKIKFLDEETVYVTHLIDKSLQCLSAVWSSFWPSKTESNTFSLLPWYNRSKALFILWPDDLCAACVFKSYSYLRFSWNVCAQQTAGPVAMTTMQRFISTTLIFFFFLALNII